MSLSSPRQNLLQYRKIQNLSVHYLFITTHVPVPVIHFSSVDTDHFRDSKLFIHIVLVTINEGHTVSNMNTTVHSGILVCDVVTLDE